MDGTTAKPKRRTFAADDRADVMGMPLQLLILVIVAVLGIGVVIGWAALREDPAAFGTISFYDDNSRADALDTIDIESGSSNDPATATMDLFIEVVDSGGAGVEGATVVLSGPTADTNQVTDGAGVATFSGITFRLPPGVQTQTLTVSVSKSGFPPTETSIIVRRA